MACKQCSADATAAASSPHSIPSRDASEAGDASGQETREEVRPRTDGASSGAESPEPGARGPLGQGTAALELGYELLEVVGSGAYATVVAARDRVTGEMVAMKRQVFEPHEMFDGVPGRIFREASALRDFEHPNVVLLKEVLMRPDECDMIFEYVPDDLHGVLKGHWREGTKLPMASVLQYSQGLLSGTHACHIRNIIHRDLKPRNLLIHPVDGVKICDFGIARVLSPPHTNYTPNLVTLWYRCPELLLGAGTCYGLEVDVWSCGCILAEMATNRPTFPGDSEIGTAFKIMGLLGSPTEETWPGFEKTLVHWSARFPRFPPSGLRSLHSERPELGEAGVDMLRALLAMNPASRPTARRARDHAFLMT